MPSIFASDAPDHLCPYNDFAPCAGPRCMAWVWNGRTHDRCETDNLTETEDGPRPVGAPRTPEGEGWQMDGPAFSKGYHRSDKDKLPKATGQRWIRDLPKQTGSCSRGGQDSYGAW